MQRCQEGSRLEGVMDKTIQQRIDKADVDPNSPEQQRMVTEAEKAEEEFREHIKDCSECEVAAR
jgi:hypothetical protein